MDCSVDKELAGWMQTESCGACLYVQGQVGDEWCLPGHCLGTGALQCLHQRHSVESSAPAASLQMAQS